MHKEQKFALPDGAAFTLAFDTPAVADPATVKELEAEIERLQHELSGAERELGEYEQAFEILFRGGDEPSAILKRWNQVAQGPLWAGKYGPKPTGGVPPLGAF